MDNENKELILELLELEAELNELTADLLSLSEEKERQERVKNLIPAKNKSKRDYSGIDKDLELLEIIDILNGN